MSINKMPQYYDIFPTSIREKQVIETPESVPKRHKSNMNSIYERPHRRLPSRHSSSSSRSDPEIETIPPQQPAHLQNAHIMPHQQSIHPVAPQFMHPFPVNPWYGMQAPPAAQLVPHPMFSSFTQVNQTEDKEKAEREFNKMYDYIKKKQKK